MAYPATSTKVDKEELIKSRAAQSRKINRGIGKALAVAKGGLLAQPGTSPVASAIEAGKSFDESTKPLGDLGVGDIGAAGNNAAPFPAPTSAVDPVAQADAVPPVDQAVSADAFPKVGAIAEGDTANAVQQPDMALDGQDSPQPDYSQARVRGSEAGGSLATEIPGTGGLGYAGQYGKTRVFERTGKEGEPSFAGGGTLTGADKDAAIALEIDKGALSGSKSRQPNIVPAYGFGGPSSEQRQAIHGARLDAIKRGDFRALEKSYDPLRDDSPEDLRRRAIQADPLATYTAELGQKAAGERAEIESGRRKTAIEKKDVAAVNKANESIMDLLETQFTDEYDVLDTGKFNIAKDLLVKANIGPKADTMKVAQSIYKQTLESLKEKNK